MRKPRGIAIRELGHVSFFVRDLAEARRFYRDILGLAETGTAKNGRIVFFSAGRHHHDVSCELMRAEGPGPPPHGAPGLYHVAFDIGASLDDLRTARAWVESHGQVPFGETETAFCVRDPDGHIVELYVTGVDDQAPETARSASKPHRGGPPPRTGQVTRLRTPGNRRDRRTTPPGRER